MRRERRQALQGPHGEARRRFGRDVVGAEGRPQGEHARRLPELHGEEGERQHPDVECHLGQ
eukprot:9731623-Lingulodinium_polyedra.AAC.1